MRSILISSINNRKQAISAAKNKLNMSLLKAAAFIDSIISNKYPTILVYEDQEAYHFVLVMSLFSDAKIIYSEQEKEEQKIFVKKIKNSKNNLIS